MEFLMYALIRLLLLALVLGLIWYVATMFVSDPKLLTVINAVLVVLFLLVLLTLFLPWLGRTVVP